MVVEHFYLIGFIYLWVCFTDVFLLNWRNKIPLINFFIFFFWFFLLFFLIQFHINFFLWVFVINYTQTLIYFLLSLEGFTFICFYIFYLFTFIYWFTNIDVMHLCLISLSIKHPQQYRFKVFAFFFIEITHRTK